MRPVVLKVGPFTAANASLLVASVTPTSGTALTLATTIVDASAIARRLVVTAGSEASGRTLAVVGTGRDGQTQTETITIPASTAGTYGSVLDYVTITSLTPAGGGWTAATTVGTTASASAGAPNIGSSPWVRLDDYALGQVSFVVDVTGAVTWTVDQSNDDPNLVLPQVAVALASMTWITPPDATLGGAVFTNSSVSKAGSMQARPLWLRLTATQYTTTGFATLTVSQAGGGQ